MSPEQSLEVVDLAALLASALPAGGGAARLHEAARWASHYLTAPHPDLGRRGAVCPYAQRAIDRRCLYLAPFPWQGADPVTLRERVLAWRGRFLELMPRKEPDAVLRALLLVFPDGPPGEAERWVESLQRDLKGRFVEAGLMLGEFHAGPPPAPGLWNQDFRPLRSPVPLLAIRTMVAGDFLFLAGRREWVESYLRRFADEVPPYLAAPVAAACRRWGLAWTATAAPASTEDPRGPGSREWGEIQWNAPRVLEEPDAGA